MSFQADRIIWEFFVIMSITRAGSRMETAGRASVGHSGPGPAADGRKEMSLLPREHLCTSCGEREGTKTILKGG